MLFGEEKEMYYILYKDWDPIAKTCEAQEQFIKHEINKKRLNKNSLGKMFCTKYLIKNLTHVLSIEFSLIGPTTKVGDKHEPR